MVERSSDPPSNVIPFGVFEQKRRAAASPLRLPIPMKGVDETPRFAILYIADLEGRPSTRPEEDWAPRAVDRGSLDALIAKVAPRVTLDPGGQELTFRALGDFDPDAIAARVPDASLLPPILSSHALRSLESAWRGLARIIDAIPENVDVHVDAMGIPRAELLEDLDESPEPSKTQLHALLHERPYHTGTGEDGRIRAPTGRPYALVVLGHTLMASPLDAGLLRGMATVCARSQCTLIADGRAFGEDPWGSLDALARSDAARVIALVGDEVPLREAHPSERSAPRTHGVASLTASLVTRYAERGASAVTSAGQTEAGAARSRRSGIDATVATTLSGDSLTKRLLEQHLARRLCLLELDGRSPTEPEVAMQRTVASIDDWLLSLADGRRGRLLERSAVTIEEGKERWSRPTFHLRARALPPLCDAPADLEVEGQLPREP